MANRIIIIQGHPDAAGGHLCHALAEAYALGPARVQLQNKDPIGWRRSVAHVAEHPADAAAKTLRTVQASRASLYDLEGFFSSSAAGRSLA